MRAQGIIAGKRKANTKAKYSGMYQNSFVPFIADKYGQFLHDREEEGDGNIIFFEEDVDLDRVSESAFLAYFGHVSVKRDPQSKAALNPPQYQSFSHVSGYNSAIRSFFRDRRIDMGKGIDVMIKDFLGSYKRTVAGLKQSGEMALQEGKAPISFDGYRLIVKNAHRVTEEFCSPQGHHSRARQR